MSYSGERPCEARNCPERATWVVIYGAMIARHRKPTAYLCERHARLRRDTRNAYIENRRPLPPPPR